MYFELNMNFYSLCLQNVIMAGASYGLLVDFLYTLCNFPC